jgi:hypothetical protein
VSVPRPLPQVRAAPAVSADLANWGRPSPGRRRRAAVDGLANGPAAGCPGDGEGGGEEEEKEEEENAPKLGGMPPGLAGSPYPPA